MKKIWIVLVIAVMAIILCGISSFAQEKGKIFPAAAVYLPYGSEIKTELNLSDDDILGFIKNLIPMIKEYAPKLIEANVGSVGNEGAKYSEMLKTMDITPLQEAISGVKSIRILVADFKGKETSKQMLSYFEKGALKTGNFNKLMSDSGNFGSASAIYLEADKGGYLAYKYDEYNKEIYSARLIGFLDVEKITKWVMEQSLKYSIIQKQQPEPAPDSPAVPSETPSDAPVQAPVEGNPQ